MCLSFNTSQPVSSPPTPLSSSHFLSPPDIPSSISNQKIAGLQETTTKQGKRYNEPEGKSPHREAGKGNPTGGRVLKAGKSQTDKHLLKLSGVPEKHQAHGHSIHTEDLLQAHAGLMLATSVSESPYEPCLRSPGVLHPL